MGRKKRGGGGGGEGGKPPPQGNEGGSQPPKQAQAQGGGQQHQQPQQAQAQRGGQQHQQPQQAQAQRGGQHGQHQQTQRAPPPGFETTGQQPQTPAPQGVWGRGGQQPPSQQAPKGRGLPPAGRGGGRVPMPSPGAPAAVPSRDPPGPPSGITMGGQPPEMGLGRDLKQEPARSATEGQQRRPGQQGQKPKVAQPSPAASTSQPQGGPKQAPKGGPPKRDQGGAQRGSGDAPDVEMMDVKKLSQEADFQGEMENLVISPRKRMDQKKKPGKRQVVETNHLAITFKNKNIIAYHYDVTFDPDKPKYLIRPAWNEFARRFFPGRHPSFDGKKNVFSNGPLPLVGEGSMAEEIEVYNTENDRTKQFKITIKLANNNIDLSKLLTYVGAKDERGLEYPRLQMQCIDIVLRNLPANQLVQSGRLFFSPPQGQIVSLGEGLDMWYGFHQSAILGWKPYLNVDIAHKGFPKPCNLLETLRDICYWDGRSDLDRDQQETFRKYIKNLKVEYQIPRMPSSKRVFRVNGIGEIASASKFKLDDGTTTTVARYYETAKNYRLDYPHLPCLWVGPTSKKIYIPLELCKVVQGQVLNGKMTENQTSVMVKNAATGTDIRKRKIMEQIRKAEYGSSPFANEFGVSVAGEFEKVEARILDPPKLKYGQNRTENPRGGVWRGAVFNKPAVLRDWCIISLNPRTREDELSRLEDMLVRTARDLDMNPSNSSQRPDRLNPRADLEKVFTDLKAKQIRIVFVVVPDQGETYSRVKKISELRVGILTQCLKGVTVSRKLNPATLGNILLKVNAKLNGVNLILDTSTRPACFNKPVMIVGADVTHPSPDSKDIPSVAAVAASHDANGFQYNMIIRLQDPRDEMIRDFQNIMREQLIFFYKRTGFKPEKIVFFRDGVSDGQIEQVFRIEFMAMRRACKGLQADYEPNITFVIVQKRHHTRFFPDKRDCDERNRNLNVLAGTCVDTDIVHPRETDFYLVSHAAIQGTSRPTKYRLVWDDNNMDEVELQKLTYHLCHLFSRCTRSVSYPAPTYNAHLAAFRGRVYLEGERVNLESLPQEQQRRKIHEHIRQNSPMHFV